MFEALRKEILAIDPVVYEEIFKYYIAYKAESNFVDIGPRDKSIALTLNMPFERLNDPKRKGRNVSNVGTWGNGDIEVKIWSLDEIPYALSLIRQSFDFQVGNGHENI